MKRLLIFFNFIFIAIPLKSQTFIDTVYSVNWGEGQDFGRTAQYFSQNIFNSPSPTAAKFTPEASEEEICSLGKGGEIIVGSKDYLILDKPGIDFVIFENVFVSTNGAKIFVEPAIISVSKDGINYVEFPYDSATLAGLAGINWTNGSFGAFDFPACGGDGFDLAEIGMDSITHIKIKDISLIASTLDKANPFYSSPAMITGFDLDAVSLVNVAKKTNGMAELIENIFLLEVGDMINFYSYTACDIKIFDIIGNILEVENAVERISYVRNKFASGIYFIEIKIGDKCEYIKFVIV